MIIVFASYLVTILLVEFSQIKNVQIVNVAYKVSIFISFHSLN